MLEDLSASIKALLEYELKTPGEEVIPDLSISFDQPDETFPPASITKPAVNLFMYDIREDLKLRHNERFFNDANSPTSNTVSREPQLLECSYLVTAWSDSETTAAHDEHYVVSTILRALRRYNCLPETLPNKVDPNGVPVQILQGSLQGVNPLPRAFTIQNSYFQGLGEFWRSMGHEVKPKLNYSVTIAVDVHEPSTSTLVNTVELALTETEGPTAVADTSSLQLLPPDTDTGLSAGSEFWVNTNTTNVQSYPAIAASSEDKVFVVWQSADSGTGDSSAYGIAGRLYDASGNPLTDELLINENTSVNQWRSSVAYLTGGGFVVVWEENDESVGDTDSYGIAARLFDENGVAQGSDFQVNTHTSNLQGLADVAGLNDGSFVVVWHGDDTATGDTDGYGVSAKIFAADASVIKEEFLVNAHVLENQRDPFVEAFDEGGFIVVWSNSDPAVGDNNGVAARRFDARGEPIEAEEFPVNTHEFRFQDRGVVETFSDGSFIIAWTTQDPNVGDASPRAIAARHYDVDANALGDEFLVNTTTAGNQIQPSIAALADGRFIITWYSQSLTFDADGYGIHAQLYESDATPVGTEFLINTSTVDNQTANDVVGLNSGGFVSVWQSDDNTVGDVSKEGIDARQYVFAETVVVDVLANDSGTEPDDALTLDAVTVDGELGRAWIAANKLVFDAGTDFDYLAEGETTDVTVFYTMSDAKGLSTKASVAITVTGRAQ